MEEFSLLFRIERQAKRRVGHGRALVLEGAPAHAHVHTEPFVRQVVLLNLLRRKHQLKLPAECLALVELLVVLEHLQVVHDDRLQKRDQRHNHLHVAPSAVSLPHCF